MIDNSAIDEIEGQFDGWKHQKLVVALKLLQGNQFIDARKWTPVSSGSSEMKPTKGLMLAVNDWPKAIEMINEMLKRHKSNIKKRNE